MSPTPFSRRSQWAFGQPISDLMARALANPELISLAAGFVDQQSLPVDLVRQAVDKLLDDPHDGPAALQYGSTPGSPALREALLSRLEELDGELEIGMEQLIVTAGSNQLLHLICDAAIDEDDLMLCASPTYLVFLGIMKNVGGHCWGVASDDQGMLPEALDESLADLSQQGRLPQVKGIYLVSYFDNPASRTAGWQRRRELREVVDRWSSRAQHPLLIIEDAAYRQMRFEGEDVPSMLTLDRGASQTVYLGTFSKTFSPGIRVGWGVLPPSLAEVVCDLKSNSDFGSPHFNQLLIERVLRDRLDEPHIERLTAEYRRKRDAMLGALQRCFGQLPGFRWQRPEGGLYVWLELPESIETGPDSALWAAALEQGMIYVPGEYCCPDYGVPPLRNAMRLSFGVQSAERIAHGIELLAEAVGHCAPATG